MLVLRTYWIQVVYLGNKDVLVGQSRRGAPAHRTVVLVHRTSTLQFLRALQVRLLHGRQQVLLLYSGVLVRVQDHRSAKHENPSRLDADITENCE